MSDSFQRAHGRGLVTAYRYGSTALEPLEPRTHLSGFSWSAAEVYLSELINRARSNPQAEGQRLGINLAQGLSAGQASRLVPQEPLVLSAALTQSARAHALDMATRNFFGHTNPSGLSPTQRAQASGYAGTAGENIGAQYSTIDALYAAWMGNATQRVNILSLYQYFDATYHYDHLGVGIATGVSGSAYSSYFAADFGNPSSSARKTTLLGVVFNDIDSNGFYGLTEGLGNIRIDVARSDAPGTVVATYTTDSAGNYQIDLAAGEYTATFTRLSDGWTCAQSVTIASQNVRVAVTQSMLQAPPPPDDHADAGEWNLATAIPTDPSTGHGAALGEIEAGADTDLFTFIAAKSGMTTLSGLSIAGLPVRVRLFNASGSPLATGAASGNDSVLSFSLVAGQRYYLLVQGRDSNATGAYAVTIQGPAPVDPGPPDEPPNGGDPEDPDPDPDPEDPPPEEPPADPPSNTVPSGQRPAVGFTSTGESTMTFLNAAGRPIFAQQREDGGWDSVDLFEVAGGAALRGELSVFVDPKNRLTYVVGVSDAGLMLYKRSVFGVWSVRNLSGEVAGAKRIVSTPNIVVDAFKRVHILVRTADGSIAEYWQDGERLAPGDLRFRHTDVRSADLAPQGQSLPALVGELSVWKAKGGTLHMAAVTTSGNVLVFTRPRVAGTFQAWTFANVTQATGAPAIVGSISAGWNAARNTVAGVDSAGNLWYFDQRPDATWRGTNVTQSTGGPALSSDGVSGYINRIGAGFIMGLSTTGELIAYRATYPARNAAASWTVLNLSAAFTGTPVFSGSVRIGFKLVGGKASVCTTTEDGAAVRFSFTPASGWQCQNVTEEIVL